MRLCEKYVDQCRDVSVRCPICGSDKFNNNPISGIPLDIRMNYHFCFSCANCGFHMKIDLHRMTMEALDNKGVER